MTTTDELEKLSVTLQSTADADRWDVLSDGHRLLAVIRRLHAGAHHFLVDGEEYDTVFLIERHTFPVTREWHASLDDAKTHVEERYVASILERRAVAAAERPIPAEPGTWFHARMSMVGLGIGELISVTIGPVRQRLCEVMRFADIDSKTGDATVTLKVLGTRCYDPREIEVVKVLTGAERSELERKMVLAGETL